MFDIGWTELLLIGIVALIVVGPKELPGMFRKMGQITGKARAMARDFQRAMDSAADEAGVKDIQRDFRKATSIKSLGMDEVETSIRSGLTAEDFTKDWNGNPIDRGPAKPASDAGGATGSAEKTTPAAAGSKAAKASGAAAKPSAKSAAKASTAAKTAEKTAAKAAPKTADKTADKSAAKSAPKASAKAGGKRA